MRTVTLALAELPQPVVRALSPNGRASWPVRRRARMVVAARVVAAVRAAGLGGLDPPVRVRFRWTFSTSRRRDLDNLAGSGVVKATLDALVREGVLPDDNHAAVVEVATEINPERGPRRVEVVLEELGDGGRRAVRAIAA